MCAWLFISRQLIQIKNILEWLDEYTKRWPKRGVLDVEYGVILSLLWSKTEFPEDLPITDRLLENIFHKTIHL